MNPKHGKRSFLLLFSVFLLGAIAMAATGATLNQTDQSAFCGSCHVMSEAVWTHSNSIHANLACNECHTPHNLAAKLPFKGMAGLRDVYHNTFTKIPDRITARDDTKMVVQANCLRCHNATTMTVAMDSKQYCTDCHRAVPHMNRLPLDKRKAADV